MTINAEKNSFLPQSIVWKAVLVLFMVYGIISTIYSTGLSERKEAIKMNTASTVQNAKQVATLNNDMAWMKDAIATINRKLDIIIEKRGY